MDRTTESWSVPTFEHARFLARLARGLTTDEHSAADLVQETWVRALERPPRSARGFRGWLATTARNLAGNARRGEARRREREQRSARGEALEPDDLALARLEGQREVFDLVLTLPEASRTILFLRYYEDLPPREIAARLGVPVKTAKNRQTRALAELRERLDRRHGGKREAWVLLLAPLARPEFAPSSSVPASTSPVAAELLGGLLAMKKAILALCVLVGIVVVWRSTRPGDEVGVTAPAVEDSAGVLPAPVAVAETPEVEAPLVEPDPRRAIESESAAPVQAGVLRVGLRWSDGSPAVDVGIDARPYGEHFPRKELWREWTDAGGFARFEGLSIGKVSLSIDRGFNFEGIEVTREEREVLLDLPDGLLLEGRVVDPAGRSIAGAEIWTLERSGWPSERPIARTDGAGSFVLRALGEEALVGARAAGFTPSVFFEVESLPVGPSGERTVAFELGPAGGRIEGRVVDPNGHPLQDALVVAGPRGGENVDLPSGQRGINGIRSCVSSRADGSFVLPSDFPAGVQPVFAVARGLPIATSTVDVRAGATASVEIRLARAASVVGRVLAQDGEAVEGATIRTGDELGGGWFFDPVPPSRARSGADGAFRLECVAPGAQALNAVGPSARLGRANATIVCREGEETRADLVLDRGSFIEGRVVGLSGAPLAGWIVSTDNFGNVYPRQDETDEDGRFLLANVGQGTQVLRVLDPDQLIERARTEARPGEAKEIVVEALASASAFLEGAVVDLEGEIPHDVSVVRRADGSREAYFVDYDVGTGRFECGPIVPGRYGIEVLRGWKTVAQSEILDVPENGRVDFGTVRIEEPGSIELEIRGFAPEVAGKLRPSLDRPNHATESFTLQDGRLLSGKLPPGAWTVGLGEREVYVRPTPVEVRPGETVRVELVPERTSLVTVTYVLPEGEAWHAIDVEVQDETGTKVSVRTVRAREGDLSNRPSSRLHLPRGRMTFVARTDAGHSASATLDIDPGSRPQESLELRFE